MLGRAAAEAASKRERKIHNRASFVNETRDDIISRLTEIDRYGMGNGNARKLYDNGYKVKIVQHDKLLEIWRSLQAGLLNCAGKRELKGSLNGEIGNLEFVEGLESSDLIDLQQLDQRLLRSNCCSFWFGNVFKFKRNGSNWKFSLILTPFWEFIVKMEQ